MSKTSPPPSDPRRGQRSRVPFGLLGMLVLVAGVESYFDCNDVEYSSTMAASWREGGRARGGQVDLLFFGDSMVKFGLQPRVVRASLGWSARNDAIYGGPTVASVSLLRRELERGMRPRAIVVDCPPEFLLSKNLELYDDLLPELIDAAEAIDLARTVTDGRWLARFLAVDALPSLRKRYEVREKIRQAFQGQLHPNHSALARMRNWARNNGAEVLPRGEVIRDEVPDKPEFEMMFRVPWTPSPLNVNYLDQFFALAGEAGIPVFWLLPPNLPVVDARREAVGMNRDYEAFVRSRLERHPHVVVLDGRRGGFGVEHFLDVVHLNRVGAVALTLAVADAVRDRLERGGAGASRWVPISARTDRPDLVERLEDNLQSHFILQAKSARVVR